MDTAFHTEDPGRVGRALNIFLFTNLSPLAGSEAARLTRNWDMILGGGTFTYFSDTSLLMGKQKVTLIAGWYEAASQLDLWAVFCMVFLVDEEKHPATFEMFLLIEETSSVSMRLLTQERKHPTFTAAFLHLIQQEFNDSFRQVLERPQRFRLPDFEGLRRALTKGSLRPDLVALPRGSRFYRTFLPTASGG